MLLGGRWFFGGSLGFGWPDDEVRDGGGLAAGFFGVADGLLAFRWEVEQSGGDEDLEVALGGVVAFGAVADGLAGVVPGDFLKREEMAQ